MLGSRSRSTVICTRMMRAGSFEPENFTQSTMPDADSIDAHGRPGTQTGGIRNVKIKPRLLFE